MNKAMPFTFLLVIFGCVSPLSVSDTSWNDAVSHPEPIYDQSHSYAGLARYSWFNRNGFDFRLLHSRVTGQLGSQGFLCSPIREITRVYPEFAEVNQFSVWYVDPSHNTLFDFRFEYDASRRTLTIHQSVSAESSGQRIEANEANEANEAIEYSNLYFKGISELVANEFLSDHRSSQ